jgi:N-acetylglucosamine kinase-like BadF-type ATPase
VSQLLLGVDGGGTKTIALVADGSGNVLGAGRAGPSDIHNVVPEMALANVEAAAREAVVAAGLKAPDLGSCVFGLCGADWPEDVTFYADGLQPRLGLARPPVVTNDAFNSLRAGTADGVGVALVLGTGGAVAARGPSGQTWFSGERMERSGASEFGRWAYDLIIRGEYGAGPRPGFEAAAVAAFGVDDVEAMVKTITRTAGLGYRSIARLAPVFLDAGHGGDVDAAQMLRDHADVLGGYVRRAAARVGLGDDGMTLVLAGGVFRHHGTDLREAIAAVLPSSHVTSTILEPAYGALLMAADRAGRQLEVERLEATGPDIRFFDTVYGT